MKPVRCPSCGTSMFEERDAGVHIDRCAQCRAIWFDHEEFRTYVEGKLDATALSVVTLDSLEHTGEPTACPRCETRTLDGVSHRGVSFGLCSSCLGTFFSVDALSAIPGVVKDRPGEPSLWKDIFEGAAEGAVAGLGCVPNFLAWILLRS